MGLIINWNKIQKDLSELYDLFGTVILSRMEKYWIMFARNCLRLNVIIAFMIGMFVATIIPLIIEIVSLFKG